MGYISRSNTSNNEIDLLIETIKYLKANKNNSMILTEYQFIISEINRKFIHLIDGLPLMVLVVHYKIINIISFILIFKDQLKKNNIEKIYTILYLNKESFEFVLNKDIKTKNKPITFRKFVNELFLIFTNELNTKSSFNDPNMIFFLFIYDKS